MISARSHSARAEGFGRTARVMAALRRRTAKFEFHLSICAGAISPTPFGRSDWMQCLLRAAVFALRLGVDARLLSEREVDCEGAGCVIAKFRFIVYDQMTPARRLLGLQSCCIGGGDTHIQVRRCVLGQQRW